MWTNKPLEGRSQHFYPCGAVSKYDRHISRVAYENRLLVGCLLGERCSGQTPRLPQGFSVKLQLQQGSTHRRGHDWPSSEPDMGEWSIQYLTHDTVVNYWNSFLGRDNTYTLVWVVSYRTCVLLSPLWWGLGNKIFMSYLHQCKKLSHINTVIPPAYKSTTVSPLQSNPATRSFSVMFPAENMHLVTSNSYLKQKVKTL